MQKESSLSLSGKSAKKIIGFDPKPAIVQVRSNYLLTQILNHSRLIQEITLVNDIMTRYETQVRFFFTPKSMEHGERLRLLSGREDNIVKLENSTCPPMGLVV